MNERDNKYCTLVYDDVIRILPLAYLIRFEDKIVAVPRSISEINIKDKLVAVPEWFVIQEELEGYIDE